MDIVKLNTNTKTNKTPTKPNNKTLFSHFLLMNKYKYKRSPNSHKKIIIKNMNKSLKERIEDPSYQSDLKLIDELSSSLPSSENTQKIESKIKEKELEIEEIFAEIEQIKNELQDIEVNMAPREFKIMKKSKFYSYLLFNLDATFLESDEVNLRLSDSFDQVILSKLLQ